MRLSTWNCCWKLGEKLPALLAMHPDICVVQECSKASLVDLPDDYSGKWLHGSEDHGLGLIHRSSYKITKVAVAERAAFACIDVEGPFTFRLIAAWNCPPKGTSYIAHLHALLDEHGDWFDHPAVVLAGDLNSEQGASFDKGPRTHVDFTERLKEKHILDAYAALYEGGESLPTKVPTYRHQWSMKALFHLDYVFVSESLLDRTMGVEIGSPHFWSKLSDHSPVTVTIGDA